METVYKPWGKEIWLALNEHYCYKRISINAGSQTSYHYHEVKTETNYIALGKAEVWLENDEGVVEKKIMEEGESFTVLPPRKHRVVAITDVILQEVSTPEVDDVIRLEDDTNRPDGRLEREHNKPGVMILAAGKGERLKSLTDNINKALLPVNNQAIISKIIKKFSAEYKFVITLGYKGKMIEEYLKITYPEYDFEFVYIDDFESDKSGPGYSALACEKYLQRPFYLITTDCLISSPLPSLDGNWLGVHPTGYPEKYSTVKFDDNNKITDFVNKSITGFDHAFIGIAGIQDYEVFWNELNKSITNGELVSSFENTEKYKNFHVKILEWFDTGNIDDLEKAKLYFRDEPLSLSKSNNEIVYKEESKFIKFIVGQKRLENLYKRGTYLGNKIPANLEKTENFLHYGWMDGATLYEKDDINLYKRFISDYLEKVQPEKSEKKDLENFYKDKTLDRINQFIEKNGSEYFTKSYSINSVEHSSLDDIIKKFSFEELYDNPFTQNFHGDLQFDNILFSNEKFYYLDWRDSFGSSVKAGDVYYDLSKLYGGIITPYNFMKDDNNIDLNQNNQFINFKHKELKDTLILKDYFEREVVKYGHNIEKIKKITGLIFINMSPLHNDKFSKLLWFKGISILNKFND
jgi:choline kinase/quercetin dioxygenase-like cupin family protein